MVAAGIALLQPMAETTAQIDSGIFSNHQFVLIIY